MNENEFLLETAKKFNGTIWQQFRDPSLTPKAVNTKSFGNQRQNNPWHGPIDQDFIDFMGPDRRSVASKDASSPLGPGAPSDIRQELDQRADLTT